MIRDPVDDTTIIGMFCRRMVAQGDRELIFIKENGRWVGMAAAEGLEKVRRVALALREMGVGPGDRVAILCGCRPEWGRADMAILANRAVTVGIFTSLPAGQVGYILKHSEARAIFVENRALFDRLREAGPLPALRHIIYLGSDAPAAPDVVPVTEVEAKGDALCRKDPGAFDRMVDAVRPEDLATVVYTSGTTGPPKGAMLTHGNIMRVVDAAARALPTLQDDIGVAFLPFEHVLQRVAGYAGIYQGARGAFAPSLDKDVIIETFRYIRPTIQASVPRIWEKLYHAIHAQLAESSFLRQAIFHWAYAVGVAAAEYRKRGLSLPLPLRIRHAIADGLVFRRIRRLVFGGRVRWLTSGGAPISPEILDFFYALGILVLEGWGLTECSAPATLNRPEAFRFGTVGKPIPEVEVKVADDGELLLKGPGIFRGYYKDEEATRAAFDADGWFRTGDIGEIDADGFVKITDRKKELIVLSTGKKIPPQNVENLIKRSPYVSNCYVHGDRQKYLVALVTLDEDAVRAAGGGGGDGIEALARSEKVRALVEEAVAQANRELASYEQVKDFRIVTPDFSVADGTLTPTLKLVRRVVADRHRATLEQMAPRE